MHLCHQQDTYFIHKSSDTSKSPCETILLNKLIIRDSNCYQMAIPLKERGTYMLAKVSPSNN